VNIRGLIRANAEQVHKGAPSVTEAPAPLQPDRLRGRALQARRLRKWSANPCCVRCGRLTAWPNGFDLDHRVSLEDGGQDTDDNTHVLCNGPDGCHRTKTAQDRGYVERKAIGADGWPK
jgi:5-methylcytosine-specific restriction protein A